MLGFFATQARIWWYEDLPTIWRWFNGYEVTYRIPIEGATDEAQPAVTDEGTESNSEEANEVQQTSSLNRYSIEKKYINELFALHGIAAHVKPRGIGAHAFYGFGIELSVNGKGAFEKWSNIHKIAPQIETILHNKRIESGAIAEGVRQGLIGPDFRTTVRVTDQPMMLEVSRIDSRTLFFDAAQYEGDSHTAFAGIGYANGRAIDIIWHLDNPDTPHLMIAGRTGSGKSVLLSCVVGTLAHNTHPDDLELYLIDGKNEDLVPFAKLPHAKSFTHKAADNMHVIEYIAGIVEERNESDERKRIVLVIDELAEVIKSNDKADVDHLIDCLSTIAQKGRSKNVTLIGCTQRPTAEVVGGAVKSNIPLKFIGAVGSPEDAKLVSGLKQTGAEKLPGLGSFLAVQSAGISRFQSPLIDDPCALVEEVCTKWGYVAQEPSEEIDGVKNITASELSKVFEQYYNGIDDDTGDAVMGRGWKSAAMKVLNDGELPPKGRRWTELSSEVSEWFQEWFQEVSAMVPGATFLVSGEDVPETTGKPSGNLRETKRKLGFSMHALAVKPVFSMNDIKH